MAEEMLEVALRELEKPCAEVYPFWLLLEVLQHVDVPVPAQFLELGCGTGHYSELLERERPGRFRYTGADYSPALIDSAKRQWPGREFFVADVFDPDLSLAPYDVVCAAGLIEVLADWKRALKILLSAPAPDVVIHRQRLSEGRSKVETETHYGGRLTYCSYLSLRDLERIAARHGRRVAAHAWREGEAHHSLLLTRTER